MKSSREVNGEIYIFKVKGVHTSSQSQTQLYLNLFSSCVCQNTRNWTRFLPVVRYSSNRKVKTHHGLHNHAWLASLLLLLSQNTQNMGHEEIIAVVREAHAHPEPGDDVWRRQTGRADVTVTSRCDSEARSGIHRLPAQRPVSPYQPVMTGTHFHLLLDPNPSPKHHLLPVPDTLHALITCSPFPSKTSVNGLIAGLTAH